jgi:hypothetical protein
MMAASTGTSPSAFYLLLIYKVEIVGVYICMFAYSSREYKPICTILGMLISSDEKENLGRSKLRKSVLSLSPGEGGSCSL